MANRIKGITVQIGGDTTGLDKALKGVNKEINDTQSQLRDVERLLKMDPQNVTLLEQKQRLLSQAVEDTGTKLDALKDAEKQVQKQFERGDIGRDQYEALQREIIATEHKLDGFQSSARQTEKAINGIDEDPVEDVKRAADKAADALDDASDQAADFGDVLRAGALIEGVKGIAGGVRELTEETAEYRKIMGTLETSSAAAGYTAAETDQAYTHLFEVLGDEQSTATTVANLQAMGLEQDDLIKAIDLAAGAWATYGDSIPIDGLAEAINETAKTGKVTGTFADVLNWAGQSEDEFNEKLEGMGNEGDRANAVLQAMADQGLLAAADAWRENNAEIVDANGAQAEYMDQASRIGETLSPVISTVREELNDLLGGVADYLDKLDIGKLTQMVKTFFDRLDEGIGWLIDHKEVLLAGIAAIITAIGTLKVMGLVSTVKNVITGVTTLTAAFPALSGAITLLTTPVALVAGAIVGLVLLIATKGEEIKAMLANFDSWLQDVFYQDWSEMFGPLLGGVLTTFFETIDAIWLDIYGIMRGVIDFIQGVFTGDWEMAWQGVSDIFQHIFDGLVEIAKAPINGILALLNAAIDALNKLIDGLNNIGFDVPDWVPKIGGKQFHLSVPHIPNVPLLAKGGILSQGSAIVGEAGPELLTMSAGRAVVQPLTGTQTGGAGAAVNIQQVTFNGYTHAQGAALVRDLNRQLGRLMT